MTTNRYKIKITPWFSNTTSSLSKIQMKIGKYKVWFYNSFFFSLLRSTDLYCVVLYWMHFSRIFLVFTTTTTKKLCRIFFLVLFKVNQACKPKNVSALVCTFWVIRVIKLRRFIITLVRWLSTLSRKICARSKCSLNFFKVACKNGIKNSLKGQQECSSVGIS